MTDHATTTIVKTLTAEVRVLMVGSRQVTLSVYNQLDCIPHRQIDPFGRVNPRDADPGRVYAVGRDPETGVLARAKTPRWDEELDRRPYKRSAEQLALATVRSFAAIEPPRIGTDGTEREQYRHAEERAGQILRSLGAARLVCWLSPFGVVMDDYARTAGLTRAEISQADRLPSPRGAPDTQPGSQQAAQILESYQQAITAAQAYADRIKAEWSALPLIVLAGLR
jgi:hypothetical protein